MNPQSVAKFEAELRNWSDGPKYVVFHSWEHVALFPQVQPPDHILLSQIDLTPTYIHDFNRLRPAIFFLVASEQDREVMQKVKDDNPDLTIRIFIL